MKTEFKYECDYLRNEGKPGKKDALQVFSGLEFPFDSGKAVFSDIRGIKPIKQAMAFAILETRLALSRYFATTKNAMVALQSVFFTLRRKNHTEPDGHLVKAKKKD